VCERGLDSAPACENGFGLFRDSPVQPPKTTPILPQLNCHITLHETPIPSGTP
jgi:hypothetical protein